MNAAAIKAEMKEIAPSIAIGVTLTPDHYCSWDGDGPDPHDYGYDPHDVEVSASAIVGGKTIRGWDSMGGHYIKHDEPDDDLGGYLPQMIDEALTSLRDQLPAKHAIRTEIDAAVTFLTDEMKQRYAEERARSANQAD